MIGSQSANNWQRSRAPHLCEGAMYTLSRAFHTQVSSVLPLPSLPPCAEPPGQLGRKDRGLLRPSLRTLTCTNPIHALAFGLPRPRGNLSKPQWPTGSPYFLSGFLVSLVFVSTLISCVWQIESQFLPVVFNKHLQRKAFVVRLRSNKDVLAGEILQEPVRSSFHVL